MFSCLYFLLHSLESHWIQTDNSQCHSAVDSVMETLEDPVFWASMQSISKDIFIHYGNFHDFSKLCLKFLVLWYKSDVSFIFVLVGGCDSFWLLHRELVNFKNMFWCISVAALDTSIHTWSTPFVRRVLVVQPGTPLRSWLRELFPHPQPALPAHCHDCPACSCHWCWLTLITTGEEGHFEEL